MVRSSRSSSVLQAAKAATGLPVADSSLPKGDLPRDRQNLKTFQKTMLCSFFANGSCTRGEDCNFAHSTNEVRRKPNFVKTRLCVEFMGAGTCESGLHCSFAHGRSELRGKDKQSRMTAARLPGKEPEPAKLPGEKPEPRHVDDNVYSEALLHLTMFAPNRKDKAEEKEVLQWDPLGLTGGGLAEGGLAIEKGGLAEEGMPCRKGGLAEGGLAVRREALQLPASEIHIGLGHQPSHFPLAQAVTVKNTFIHFQDEAPFVALRRSKSWPARLDSD